MIFKKILSYNKRLFLKLVDNIQKENNGKYISGDEMSGMIMEINEPKNEKLITDERRNHYYMKSIILMQELMYKKIYSLLLPTESIYQNMKFYYYKFDDFILRKI